MSELEEYKSQLRDIEETLKQDPENESLLELQKELKDLISLLNQEEEPETKQDTDEAKESSIQDNTQKDIPIDTISSNSQSPQAPESSFKVGDLVYVKPKLEKEYQQVKITIISGNQKLITVKFDNDKTETYPIEEIKLEKPKFIKNKYKLKQTKLENQEKKKQNDDLELNKSAKSWQNFNKKLKRKHLHNLVLLKNLVQKLVL
ncbi:hypothetical protein BN7_3919 [Wickerhamomyces ciferrii]|uniref:Tudor domain-containing protein n=1 Tax=Wickerhamomyces ciferrii (strain ATCC 14091 / BCRC 22168 / CBS 111 / JCM 3599 / NBRC 0793 / NRRL Y-1031 F-60-10) TaxID=1206466 RepID=K0KN14_WICCF|nr:uncharacterized protein BN7_3919 [Wickerhamomyces ciferrii]CCH44356.1 hypothetical protein BN7_3919 [Wickerhamomyces ciferrii]